MCKLPTFYTHFCLLALLLHQSLALPFNSDKIALLHFKSSLITLHPTDLLSNWNPRDRDPCSWTGITCDLNSRRVTVLHLSGNPDPSCSSTSIVASGNHNKPPPLLPCSQFVFHGHNTSRITGKLPPALGLLSELRVLSLPFNALFGELPWEIGKLRFLELLDLRHNGFGGQLPASIAYCIRLEHVNLSGNQFNGSIPAFFAKLPNLRSVSLSANRFRGHVLNEFGERCAFLAHLNLAGNSLSGPIPSSLGNCSELRSLMLSSNALEGEIPASLGSLQMLESLDLSRNFLSGRIPTELGNCKKLKLLVLKNSFELFFVSNDYSALIGNHEEDFNYFEGEMPDDVVSLPNLQMLWVPNGNLVGTLPQNWGSCSELEMVNLAHNYFTGEIPSMLGSCNKLYYLDLSSNNLTGKLPEELPVPCMAIFNISRNSLMGNISRFDKVGCRAMPMAPSPERWSAFYSHFFYTNSLAQFSSFYSHFPSSVAILHDFSKNLFSGPIPPMPVQSVEIAPKSSYALFLGDNNLEGNMSFYSFETCVHLDSMIMDVSNNKIFGELPSELGIYCKCMKYLNMAGNELVGSIPPSFASLDSLVSLNLSRNKLQGSIPSHFMEMKDLRYLSLSSNYFSGKIPPQLGQMTSLEVLELSSNFFSGEIPPVLAQMAGLTILQLDHNRLSGQIPAYFSNSTSLSTFNVSFNNLSGAVPENSNWVKCENLQGNPYLQLCPNPSSAWEEQRHSDNLSQPQPYSPTTTAAETSSKLKPIEVAAVTSASIIASVLVLLIFLLVCVRRFVPKPTSAQGSGKKEVVTCNSIGIQLTYDNVVRATGGFNIQNCIGSGGFGATYMAEIEPGVVVAVKRLSVGRFQGVQQFAAEIKTLGRVQHPNLVTLIGYHVSEEEMFLIYNFLPGGNLESFLHDRSKRHVEWSMLHKIALDIARALAYLHDECVPRVLHRDIKPSNILLDNNFNAYLSDFGLARLLGTSETHATTDVAGTFGYVAPEYAMTCRVSDKADVYSYGVVLLELISDKKVLDPSFSCYGNGFNIVAWACLLLRQGRAHEVFTAGLWDSGPHDDLIDTLNLAVLCTVESLSTRPSMKQVAQKLKRIQPAAC